MQTTTTNIKLLFARTHLLVLVVGTITRGNAIFSRVEIETTANEVLLRGEKITRMITRSWIMRGWEIRARAHLLLDQRELPRRPFLCVSSSSSGSSYSLASAIPWSGHYDGDARCKTWPSARRWKRLFRCFQVTRRFLKFAVNGSAAQHPVKA